MNCPFIRYAIITGARSTHEIERALPDNYRIIHGPAQWEPYEGATYKRPVWVIAGRDSHGWTLDAYVIPRLGSFPIGCEEIDLSHPIMKEVPVDA